MTMPRAQELLREVFGFDGFRTGQHEVIEHILAGRPVLAVMPTGAGKSLCYQLPALVSDKPSIVVSPLTALMDDQVIALEGLGVPAVRVHSGRQRHENVAAWRAFALLQPSLLYFSINLPGKAIRLRASAKK
jgi:ATP-dependent DNA helicase RecQ